MIDVFFRDKIISALDNAIIEVDRDSFNLSISEQNSVKLKIENVKKQIYDMYALKIANDILNEK